MKSVRDYSSVSPYLNYKALHLRGHQGHEKYVHEYHTSGTSTLQCCCQIKYAHTSVLFQCAKLRCNRNRISVYCKTSNYNHQNKGLKFVRD